MTLHGTLTPVATMRGTLSTQATLHGVLTVPLSLSASYSGPYEITPGDETIVMETQGKSMNHDVTINAIPSNYGRIAWDGRSLTVW